MFKHTSYLSSKSSLLFSLPSSRLFAVISSFLLIVAIYVVALSAFSLSIVLPVSLLGVLVHLIEVLLPKYVWGKGWRFPTLRRISFAYLLSDAVWLLAAAASFGFHDIIALLFFSSFIGWSARVFLCGSLFSDHSFSPLKALLAPALSPLFLLGVLSFYASSLGELMLAPIIFGVIIAASSAFFLWWIDSQGSRYGLGSITLLRAFLESWVEGASEKLEEMVSSFAVSGYAKTTILRFDNVSFIVPTIHPGPIAGVGSAELPSIIMSVGGSDTSCHLFLHTLVDHEHNLAFRSDTHRYLSQLKEKLASSINESRRLQVFAPKVIDSANFRLSVLQVGSRYLVVFVEPKSGLEDFNYAVLERVKAIGARYGFEIVPVDAHNALGPDPTVDDEEELARLVDAVLSHWETSKRGDRIVRCGCCRSKNLKRVDLGPGGLATVLLEDKTGQRHVIIVADANNALDSLRENINHVLSSQDSNLHTIIFTTTDTHVYTGRSALPGGYLPLGGGGHVDDILEEIASLYSCALTSMQLCGGASVKAFKTRLSFLGAKFLVVSKHILEHSLKVAKISFTLLVSLGVAFWLALVFFF